MDRMAQWIEATPSPEPSEAEKVAGEIAFDTFHSACFQRFFKVNRDLKEISVEISSVAGTLNTLLIAIK